MAYHSHPALLNAAANVTLIVSGSDKAEPLRQVLEGPYQPHILPAQIIQPDRGRLQWLVDAEAGALLGRGQKSLTFRIVWLW